MVGLDDCGFTETGFNHVWVNRSLYQEIDSSDFLCFLFENADEFFSDDFTFCFRFTDTGKFFIETFLAVDTDKVQVVWAVRAEYSFNFVSFIFAQKSLINKDASQLFADCL